MKLGTAKIAKETHKLIHYYDLRPIVTEFDKLRKHEQTLTQNFIDTSKTYPNELATHLKILRFLENEINTKLTAIIPNSYKREKRGLINGLGSIFKSITGNLDSTDAERYDKLIEELQNNENKLETSVKTQNSLSISLIDKFNSTIKQISHNENILEEKFKEVFMVLKNSFNAMECSLVLKDALIQISTMYEIINSILQDIENSLIFTKLQIMHPSIIRTNDFFFELTKLEKSVKKYFPFELTLQNIPLFESVVKIESYIKKFRISYILHVPLIYPFEVDYYHLYSIPVYSMGQFKAIITQNKYLVKNELYFAFMSESCKQVSPKQFFCRNLDLQNNNEKSPCEIKIIDMKNASNCRQTKIHVIETSIQPIQSTNKWICLFPTREQLKLKCFNQEEAVNLLGTYLIEIPVECKISNDKQTIINEIHQSSETILFPDLDIRISNTKIENVSLHLENIKLDELYQIKNKLIENNPSLSFGQYSHIPSIWTICIYLLVICSISFMAYKKISTRCSKKPQPRCEDVQLPRTLVC